MNIYNNERMAKMARKCRRLIKEEETEKIIIRGDFNARIGKEGKNIYAEETMEEREGKSKDKMKNTKGDYLLSLTANGI